MSLYHILKLAQYRTTSIQTPITEAHSLVLGMMRKIPNPISNNPLNNTQNRGDPKATGTMGSYHPGLMKWSTPMFTNAAPKKSAKILRIEARLNTNNRRVLRSKRNVKNQSFVKYSIDI